MICLRRAYTKNWRFVVLLERRMQEDCALPMGTRIRATLTAVVIMLFNVQGPRLCCLPQPFIPKSKARNEAANS